MSKFGTRAQPLMASQFTVKTEGDNWDKVLEYLKKSDYGHEEEYKTFFNTLVKIDKDHLDLIKHYDNSVQELVKSHTKDNQANQIRTEDIATLFLNRITLLIGKQKDFANGILNQIIVVRKEATESRLKAHNELIGVIEINSLAMNSALRAFQERPKHQIHWYALYVLLGFGLSLLVG